HQHDLDERPPLAPRTEWRDPHAPSAAHPTSEVSAPPVLAALLAASVTSHDPHPEPDQRPQERGGQREQPERPREAPEQEIEPDALGVLEHEDEQQARPGQRGDGASPESTSLGLGGVVSGTRPHDHSSLLVSHGRARLYATASWWRGGAHYRRAVSDRP